MQDDIKLFAVVGNPISHSISPKIHNEWISKHNLKAFYSPLLVQNEVDFCQMTPLLPKLGFCGINITVPFKQSAFSICDEIDASAANIKAVNCIKFNDNKIIGYNTDCFGFAEPLTLAIKDNNLQIKKALIIGGGGASRAAIQALIDLKIEINIYNRTYDKLTMLLNDFSSKYITEIFTGELNKINLSEYDLIVNATSVGLKDELLDINYQTIKQNVILYDLIYKKNALTPFLRQGKNIGAKNIIDGTQMLLLQAAKSFEIWHGFMP